MRLLQTLIEEEWPDRAIIFANTKHRCEDIWGHLAADGHRVGLLTGDVAQKNACVSSTTSPKATSISGRHRRRRARSAHPFRHARFQLRSA